MRYEQYLDLTDVAQGKSKMIAESQQLRHRLPALVLARVAVPLVACFLLRPIAFGDTSSIAAAFGQTASFRQTRAQSDADFVIAGQCLSRKDFKAPIADVKIRLFAVTGLLQRSTEIEATASDAQGAFRFAGLEPPRENRLDSLRYFLAANIEGGPVTMMGLWNPDEAQRTRLFIPEQSGSIKGRVVNERGEPVVGASLEPSTGAPGIDVNPSAKTKGQGLFILRDVPIYRKMLCCTTNPRQNNTCQSAAAVFFMSRDSRVSA